MAIKNFLSLRFTLSALLITALAACQTGPKRPGAPLEQQPLPITKEEPKKIAVILGPGGAKSMAHVGVLRALQEQRIPISKVVGLEWGALIGAMFSAKGQVHDVEWKLYKMEQRNLPRPKGFFTKRLGEDSIQIMDDYLQETFGAEDIGGAKIPFTCPSRSIWSGVVTWQNRGLFKDAMKRCLAFPPLFKAQGTFLAGASQMSEAIELLRSEGFNVIIVVNVLGSAMPVGQDRLLENLNYVILWQEVKRAMAEAQRFNVDIVNVDTSNYSMVEFENKKELMTLGEVAGQKAAGALISKYGF